MNRRDNRDLSLRLYEYLCQTIGSERTVVTRRMYYAVLDVVRETNSVAKISSGSRAEGLDMKGSDLDEMHLLKNVKVVENINEQENIMFNLFVMVTDNTKFGFTKLKLLSTFVSEFILKCCLLHENELFLSNELLKLYLIQKNKRKLVIHGPCVADTEGMSDTALCFRCNTFIHQARPWITRNRVWPPASIVSLIRSYGVLFVPVGNKGSANEEFEFRISFSVAEKHLIYSFTHTQLLCYALLKILLKEIIQRDTILEDLLCSYFLKTTIFWVSEETPLMNWTPSNIVQCFLNCFHRLIYFVEYSFLPHYFIIENNLFETRFDNSQRMQLLECLKDLYKRGIFCFRNSNTMSVFFEESCKIHPQIIKAPRTDDICSQINTILSLKEPETILHDIRFTKSVLSPLRCIRKKHLKLLELQYFYRICQVIGKNNILAHESSCNNMDKYKMYKQFFPYLVLGTQCDATSGWLYIATYLYSTEQYIESLKIILHVLLKCTPDKLGSKGDNITPGHLNDIELEAYQRNYIDINDIFRRHVIGLVQFSPFSKLIPEELQIEDRMYHLCIKPSEVYAIFLTMMCSYRLKKYYYFHRALKNFQLTVEDSYFTTSCTNVLLANSYNCLGIGLLIAGDTKGAVSYFIKSNSISQGQDRFIQYVLDYIHGT